jgi:ketosteroid isomerase-like protein
LSDDNGDLLRRVQVLEDRAAIHDAMMRYLRGVDRKDWDLIRSAYFPDAIHDHGEYRGDVEGLIGWIQKWHAIIPQVLHFLGNMYIELDGDVAVVESYLQTLQDEESDAGAKFDWIGSRYLDRFERRNGEWRIAERIVPLVYTRPSMEPSSTALITNAIMSKRDGEDPLWKMRRDAGIA